MPRARSDRLGSSLPLLATSVRLVPGAAGSALGRAWPGAWAVPCGPAGRRRACRAPVRCHLRPHPPGPFPLPPLPLGHPTATATNAACESGSGPGPTGRGFRRGGASQAPAAAAESRHGSGSPVQATWRTQPRRRLLAGVSASESASSQHERSTTSQRRTTSQKFLGWNSALSVTVATYCSGFCSISKNLIST